MNLVVYDMTLPANSTQVFDIRLFGGKVLKVKLEGLGYDISAAALLSRQVQHSPLLMRLKFKDAMPVDRSVYVLMKKP